MSDTSWLRPKALLAFWVAVALLVDPQAPSGQMAFGEFGPKSAFADDDGGGGDDGGDDDGDGRSSSSSDRSGTVPRWSTRPFRTLTDRFLPRPPRRGGGRRAQRPVVPLPSRAPDQIVATGLSSAEIGRLQATGFTVLDRADIQLLGSELVRLRIPPNTPLEAARDLVIDAAPRSTADFVHYYRPGQEAECAGPHCAAAGLIGWPAHIGLPAGCGGNVTIGLIDTAINPAHAALAKGRVEVLRLSDDGFPESGRQHGTAVAALLVGGADSRTPGLLPHARLIAIDAFHRGNRQDDRSDAYDLLRALDLLSMRGVQVTNMSLSGPANALLEQFVRRLAERGMVIVAAAGNGGPRAGPSYPAAYADVIAVTAVDRMKRPYRRAGRGEHIDLAAPGVEVWTAASVSGARSKTGTSFAAPFVAAAAALMMSANSNATPADIHDALGKSAEDLGAPGKDAVFGWGLLNARAACAVIPKKAT
ncbi:S8 family serine peptidase [Mesorhizobium sp. M0938]|uniref:S8 family serine peptidase n=1 Tax=unclassified Mesorhizobium TaxID=325217 RepID=UPI0033375150